MSDNYFVQLLDIISIFLQEILENYDKDIDQNDRKAPWVGAHPGSSFTNTESYSQWLFYDREPITACGKFDKDCDNEQSKFY